MRGRPCGNDARDRHAKKEYPEVSLLQQVKDVGTPIALIYVLTPEDPHRFRRSRDVGCYLELRPGRRKRKRVWELAGAT